MIQNITDSIVKEIYNNDKKIILYGAGKVARIVLERLLNENIDIFCLAVSDVKKDLCYMYGKQVFSIDDLIEYKGTSAIIIATKENAQKIIWNKVKTLGFEYIYGISDQLSCEWERKNLSETECSEKFLYAQRYIDPYLKTVEELCMEYDMPLENKRKNIMVAKKKLEQSCLSIPRLVVVLGTKCSLRCRDCNNLMPLFKPQTDLDEQKIVRSLRNIISETKLILKCELIGGEPFLAESFGNILVYLINEKRIKEVEITTNGTILPNEKTLPLLQNPKVLVRISDYGDLVDKKRITEFLNRYQIRYQILELGSWTAPGGVKSRRRNKNELKKIYKQCPSGYFCKTLFDGKLFACARAGSLYALGYMKEKEYIDVEEDCTAEQIKEFLLKDYSAACNYCDTAAENKQYVKPAIQL